MKFLTEFCLFRIVLFLVMGLAAGLASAAEPEPEPTVLRFDISGYSVEGATLLSKEEINAAVAPYVGKSKDFSDVQRALEAVEALYLKHGFSAVHVLLPEQELEKGSIRFLAMESHFGKVTVKDNKFVTEQNVLNALPSLRSGGVPQSRKIGRELKLANENPARQMNVVLNAGAKDDEVDANVLVTDSKPTAWTVTFDNAGSKETGNTRLGLSYRHANLFDADHLASAQLQTSPEHPDRVLVLGAGYKIPRYQSGQSWEFFGGYSNVNSLVDGLTNFQGGGLMLSARNNWMLDRVGGVEPRISIGADWRKFNSLKETEPTTIVLYNQIIATPVSLAFTATQKTPNSDAMLNLSYAVNMPVTSGGKEADFANYDPVGILKPDANYSVLRYGANYMRLVGADWQLHAAFNGQSSGNVLILGEQMRLGGAEGVRGFAEGSEGGENGVRGTLEVYTPNRQLWSVQSRALVFYDAGSVNSKNDTAASIASAGLGVRASHPDGLSFRADVGWIVKEGTDPLYRKGDWRIHAAIAATF